MSGLWSQPINVRMKKRKTLQADSERVCAALAASCALAPVPAIQALLPHHCPPQTDEIMIINWRYKKQVWYDQKLRQCFLGGHAENKLLLSSVKPESYLMTWQSKSLATFHLGLKIFSLQMTLPLDECPLQKVITLSLNLHFRNLKQLKKMTENNKKALFMTPPPPPPHSLSWYLISNRVRGRSTAWTVSIRVEGDRKRCHDQEVALTSHFFETAPLTYPNWQDSRSELSGQLGPSLQLRALRAHAKRQCTEPLALCKGTPCAKQWTAKRDSSNSFKICTLTESWIY